MGFASLVTLNDPSSPVTESYKLLRTNLNYLNIDNKYQVLLFTSGAKEEGKTTTICNLAITMAQSRKRVLLIDADLRLPRVGKVFNIDANQPGLTNLLVEGLIMDAVLTTVKGLRKFDILTAGTIDVSPTELLNSPAFEQMIMACRRDYDVILIDAPPVLNFADASIVCKVSDGTILVAAAHETKKEMIVAAKNTIDKVGGILLGVVLTKVKYKKSAHYYGYAEDKSHFKRKEDKGFLKKKNTKSFFKKKEPESIFNQKETESPSDQIKTVSNLTRKEEKARLKEEKKAKTELIKKQKKEQQEELKKEKALEKAQKNEQKKDKV